MKRVSSSTTLSILLLKYCSGVPVIIKFLAWQISEQSHWQHNMLEQEHKYIRDSHSKAVINTDVDALRRYKARKAESKRILDLKNEFDSIKYQISEVKYLLTKLVDNQSR